MASVYSCKKRNDVIKKIEFEKLHEIKKFWEIFKNLNQIENFGIKSWKLHLSKEEHADGKCKWG